MGHRIASACNRRLTIVARPVPLAALLILLAPTHLVRTQSAPEGTGLIIVSTTADPGSAAVRALRERSPPPTVSPPWTRAEAVARCSP